MALKYVVLWESAPRRRGALEGGPRAVTRTRSAITPASAVQVDVEEMSLREAAQLSHKPGVSAVAPALPMKLIKPVAFSTGDDPLTDGCTWGIKAVGADASPFTGAGVTVAVLDTGIRAHAAFAGVNIIRRNFTSDGAEDTDGHGTHCAGTIFGRDVDGTRIGVARGVTHALIGKVIGAGGAATDAVARGIQWALENGANVISMSLGFDFPGFVAELQNDGYPPDLATSIALEGYRKNIFLFESLARLAVARSPFEPPCILIAAAGNESRRDEDERFEIAVSPPAIAEGVVSVAALGNGDGGFTVAGFSNTGARVCGPGVNVLSARLDGRLVAMNGTSMAAPHVAGVATLWAEKLMTEGQFAMPLFSTRILGAATQEGLAAGFDPNDVGAGMVRAPRQ